MQERCILPITPSAMADSTDQTTNDLEAICSTACCPYCGCSGGVRISALIMNRERHIHFHCPCCHHVWVERDRRSEERMFDYQPPMVK